MRPEILVILLLAAPFALPGASAAVKPGLTVAADGTLMKDGQPFRGIGVNYFNAFARTLANPEDTSYDAGFQALEDAHIPFCRMMGCGFWPVDQKLYLTNPGEFFKRFDRVVRSAEKHHIGLIPSLFWNEPTVSDLVGEPVSAWGDPKSKTQAYMRKYVRDVVTRYRLSLAIWGWEFANEFNLGASLPNAAEWRPKIVPRLGTALTRSAKDDYDYGIIRAAYAAFGREVRKYDPYRVIETGDALPRASAWHNWKEKSWTADTPEQWAGILQNDNPAPIDLISVHIYTEGGAAVSKVAALARQWKKPLFIGEFGAPGPPEKSKAAFDELLHAIEIEKVPLSALWVYDFSQQDADYNVTPANGRAYQFQAVAAANARIREAMKGP